MCRVIAVSNQKGGVGKTVSCVNLGIGLAQEGKKVLMIDADPQGSLTISLGYEEPDEMEYSLATLMMNIVNDEKLNIEKTILHHKEGVDLIPANIELSAIEGIFRISCFFNCFVFIATSPSFSLLPSLELLPQSP